MARRFSRPTQWCADLAGLFSIAALGLGFLWILRDPERQSWHDRIAGTYVVSVPRSWPLL